PAVGQRVVEWLFPHPVASEKELLAGAVPEREREHPVQALEQALARLLPRMRDDLRVGPRGETVAARAEGGAMLVAIVDLPVQDDGRGAVLGADRLIARFEIDDTQSRHAERSASVDVISDRVGAAMSERRDHALQDAPIRTRTGKRQE